ncbi:MAG: tetratricopeptide repeat protein [candidate division KSB1 bacterium]|nr:tetratricopeptide repeat protein [candidate division KSB1 bacterium]
MARIVRILLGLSICFTLLSAPSAGEQIKNKQAARYYNMALKEKDPFQKIANYKKAIELEPKFIEALYNLGLTFKRIRDYDNAYTYFMRAYTTESERNTDQLKMKLLFELAFVSQKMGKLTDAEESLRGALALAKDSVTRAQILFQLGRILYEQGRYEEALAELRKDVGIPPEFRMQFNRLIRDSEEMLKLERLYQQAEAAKNSGQYQRARSLYQQIFDQNRDFRNVAKRLTELDSILAVETKKQTLQASLQRAEKYEKEGRLELALAIYEDLAQKDPGNEIKARLQRVQEAYQKKRQQDELEREYKAGLNALKFRNWAAAIYSFEKIIKIDPSFKDARKKLTQAQKGLENENIENLIKQYYANGIAAMQNRDWDQAEAALKKVASLNPNYLDVQNLLQQIESEKALADATVKAPSQALMADELDSLYQEALAWMDQKSWNDALVALEKIRLRDPEYRDVLDLVATIRAQLTAAGLASAASAGARPGSSSLLWIGVALSAIIFPVAGAFLFIPGVRARYYLMRGNYLAASQIYERILEKNPGKIKLYRTLADLYLLMGRKDEQALKVFKMIMRLNLATPKQDEIQALLAQNYLQEGKTDDDAIRVLEAALKAETQRLQAGDENQKAN